MRILITTPIFPPEIGGPATYVYELCQRLKKDYMITVVAFGEKPEEISGVEIIGLRIDYPILGFFFRQFALLRAIFKHGKNADLIYAQGGSVVGLASALAANILKKRLMVKFVGDAAWEAAFLKGKTQKFLDDFLIQPDGGISARIEIFLQKRVFLAAEKVVVPSEYLKQVLMRHYRLPESRIEVIYNGISFHEYEKFEKHYDTKKDDGIFKIITIGRLVKWKNIAGIIRAVSLLPDKSKIKLVIVGEGAEKKYLESMAADWGMKNKVEFSGRLNHEETLEILSRGQLFILNSFYEGLPHTLIEAMYLGVPVIATAIPGTMEIAIEGKTALLSEVKNDQDLAKKIKLLRENPELGRKLLAEAEKIVKIHFSFDENIKKLAKIWK